MKNRGPGDDEMSNVPETAEGFVQVLKALPKAQRDAVIVRIAQDREFQKDILISVTFTSTLSISRIFTLFSPYILSQLRPASGF